MVGIGRPTVDVGRLVVTPLPYVGVGAAAILFGRSVTKLGRSVIVGGFAGVLPAYGMCTTAPAPMPAIQINIFRRHNPTTYPLAFPGTLALFLKLPMSPSTRCTVFVSQLASLSAPHPRVHTHPSMTL